jgi:hypothetical protein
LGARPTKRPARARAPTDKLSNIVAFPANIQVAEAAAAVKPGHVRRGQLLYSLVDADECLVGAMRRNDPDKILCDGRAAGSLAGVAGKNP